MIVVSPLIAFMKDQVTYFLGALDADFHLEMKNNLPHPVATLNCSFSTTLFKEKLTENTSLADELFKDFESD